MNVSGTFTLDNYTSAVDIKANRSTGGALRLRRESLAACHVHSLLHILARSHTHVDNHTCNVNLTAEESRPIITEHWWESHNHKDSNRNLNQRMIPDWLVPSVYSRPFWFTWGAGRPIVPCTNVNISLIEHLRNLQLVIYDCTFFCFCSRSEATSKFFVFF